MKQLREYQQKIVNKVLASNKDTLISLPTGGGKTVIATAIMQGLSGTVVFVVPRLELIKQAKSELLILAMSISSGLIKQRLPARNTSLLLKIPCVVNPERNYFRNMSQ